MDMSIKKIPGDYNLLNTKIPDTSSLVTTSVTVTTLSEYYLIQKL